MFERLAQHEDFHHTVDLSILVSAAQEKVIKWLLRWNPKKGRIFSWFSLSERTQILLPDGNTRQIGDLVNERYSGKVMCWNFEKKAFEAKQVTDWSKKPCKRKDWRKLIVTRPSGYSRYIYITKDHRVWTQTGWACVDWLNPRDLLSVDKPTLTKDGQAALLGLYLGDGSVFKNDFRVTHGKDQRFYNEWLLKKFRGNLYDCHTVGWNKFTKTTMDHSGETIMYFHAADMWPEFENLSHPKKITPWILDRLTPLSLAIWYMDDGSYAESQFGQVTLASHGFTEPERGLIVNALKCRFGITANTHKGGSIYVTEQSKNTFFSLIAPYVLQEFSYKIKESYRHVSKVDSMFVEDQIELVSHKDIAVSGESYWEAKKVFKPVYRSGETTKMLRWKYDLTVEGNHNFFAGRCKLLVSNSKCAKHAFLSELVKVNQYRKRYHVTGDNLEKYFGEVDQTSERHNLAEEFNNRLKTLYCYWGSLQERGAIRYLVECVIDLDNHDRQEAIRGAAYAYGIGIDLSKFFYNFVLVSLRDLHYDKIRVSVSEHDLLRLQQAYSTFMFLMEELPPDKIKRFIAVYGGQRFKVPTIQQVYKLKEDFKIFQEIDRSSQDPDAINEAAKKFKKTPRTASEIYHEMAETLNPARNGEFGVYSDDPYE